MTLFILYSMMLSKNKALYAHNISTTQLTCKTQDLVEIRGLLRSIIKTAPAPTGTALHIPPKRYTNSRQIYCIIFGNSLQENESSLAVIFIHFFRREDDYVGRTNA